MEQISQHDSGNTKEVKRPELLRRMKDDSDIRKSKRNIRKGIILYEEVNSKNIMVASWK